MALAKEDATPGQQLKRWAIQEAARLGTGESESILIGYALDLQNRYHDQNGKRVRQGQEALDLYAPELYNQIMDYLRKGGLTDGQIKATGLKPDQCFVMSP